MAILGDPRIDPAQPVRAMSTATGCGQSAAGRALHFEPHLSASSPFTSRDRTVGRPSSSRANCRSPLGSFLIPCTHRLRLTTTYTTGISILPCTNTHRTTSRFRRPRRTPSPPRPRRSRTTFRISHIRLPIMRRPPILRPSITVGMRLALYTSWTRKLSSWRYKQPSEVATKNARPRRVYLNLSKPSSQRTWTMICTHSLKARCPQ